MKTAGFIILVSFLTALVFSLPFSEYEKSRREVQKQVQKQDYLEGEVCINGVNYYVSRFGNQMFPAYGTNGDVTLCDVTTFLKRY